MTCGLFLFLLTCFCLLSNVTSAILANPFSKLVVHAWEDESASTFLLLSKLIVLLT